MPMLRFFGIALLAAGSLASTPPAVADLHWFSVASPTPAWAQRTRHAHGGPVEMGRGGTYVKRLWLRSGPDPDAAGYAATLPGEVIVRGPEDAAVQPLPFREAEGTGVRFPIPEEGFYDAYLLTRRVAGGTLEVEVAKAEVLSHRCSNGHDRRFTQSRMAPRLASAVPFELVRERLPQEDFHTRLTWGEPITFRALRRGEPVAGATVTLVSAGGWRKTRETDANGAATFALVRDHFPAWEVFDKDHRLEFVATAAYTEPEEGEHDGAAYSGVRYATTFSGSYYPAPRAYQSYLAGLGVALLVAALAGGGLYHYRLRQRRPRPRGGFDEKA